MKKTYVKVVVEYNESGQKWPKIVYFKDKAYEVDKVFSVSNRASFKVGGIGERFDVQILGKRTYLYFEDGKWFVEEKE